MRPYIGITGIENSSQLERMIQVFSEKGDIPHLLMIGGIVSYKTLIDVKDKPILLMKSGIREILDELKNQPSEDVLFALHYFTKPLDEIKPELREKARTVVTEPLSYQIMELVEEIYEDYEKLNPPFQIGVQINVSWPDSTDINKIKINYPKLKVILQVSDFFLLDERGIDYNVDYFLIDASRGEGVEFNLDEAIRAYNSLGYGSYFLKGFAGGLSPYTVRGRVNSIREKINTRDFCIDAQGKLRTRGNLDMDKVERYLKGAVEAYHL